MKAHKLSDVISWGLLVIVAIMPVHAFLSVWLGHIFGHQAVFQSWKEAWLLILAGLTVILLWREPSRLSRLRAPWVLAAAGFMLVGLLVTLVTRPALLIVAFGIKTDFEFLIAGIIATLVATKPFLHQALKLVLIMAAVVTGFDLLQIFILPPDFLTHFGYGPRTIAPYQHIAQGTSTLRFPATLGGPNQLGTYLILPICLSVAILIRRPRAWAAALLGASLISLIWTFSRSAWIGAAVAAATTAIVTLPARLRRPVTIIGGLILTIGLLALPAVISRGGQLQYFILHSSVANHDQANLSDAQHAASLSDGATSVRQHPLGNGLGTAGPATFRAGSVNIIENYYLQIGYETGLAGIILFLFTIFSLIATLAKRARLTPNAVPVAASLVGISLVALLLPAWVDSSTALIAWIVAGGVAGLPPQAARV